MHGNDRGRTAKHKIYVQVVLASHLDAELSAYVALGGQIITVLDDCAALTRCLECHLPVILPIQQRLEHTDVESLWEAPASDPPWAKASVDDPNDSPVLVEENDSVVYRIWTG